MRLILLVAAIAIPSAAMAANQVAISSSIQVERAVVGPDGRMKTVLADPKPVYPGNKVVFTLTYQNKSSTPASDFTITNPVPRSVEFLSTDSNTAIYSVDGGQSWGNMAALQVKDARGLRAATPADVTDIRWVLSKPIPAGGNGQVSFRGLVR